MALGSVTSLGVGSGFELQDMLEKFRDVDEEPIRMREADKKAAEEQLAEFDVVNAKVLGMKSHALSLSLESNFLDRTAVSGDEEILTATTLSGSDSINSTVKVERLATRSSLLSVGFEAEDSLAYAAPETGITSSDSPVVSAEENFTISFVNSGQAGTISVNLAADSSLEDVVAAINTAAGDAAEVAISTAASTAAAAAEAAEAASVAATAATAAAAAATEAAAGPEGAEGAEAVAAAAASDEAAAASEVAAAAAAAAAETAAAAAAVAEGAEGVEGEEGEGTLSGLSGLVTASIVESEEGSYIRISAGLGADGVNSLAVSPLASGQNFLAPDKTVDYRQGGEEGEIISVSYSAGTSFNALAVLINSDEDNPGVTAAVIDDGSGDNSFHFALTSDEEGEDHRIVAGGLVLSEAPGANESLNALLTVDGIQYQRQSNSGIDNILEGVTFDLKAEGTATLSVAPDTESIKTEIVGLVEMFNELISEINLNTSNTPEEEGHSDSLSSASEIKGIPTTLKGILGSFADTGTDVKSLFDLGFSVSRDGSVALDEGVLDKVISSDFDAIRDLFIGDSETGREGLGDILNDGIREITGFSGVINTAIDSAETKISRLETTIESSRERLDRRYDTLARQFVELDKFVGVMNNQSAYLTSVFDSFNKAQDK